MIQSTNLHQRYSTANPNKLVTSPESPRSHYYSDISAKPSHFNDKTITHENDGNEHHETHTKTLNYNFVEYIDKNSWYYLLFSSDVDGRKFRFRFTLIWGFMSLLFGIIFLRVIFQYRLSLCFFIGATAITTTGYGPVESITTYHHHNFISVYLILCVLPFTFLQVLVANDISIDYCRILCTNIEKIQRKGTPPTSSFIQLVNKVILSQLLSLACLMSFGTILYKYFAFERNWYEAMFYSIATTVSVGYGNVSADDDLGYIIIGTFVIICHMVVFIDIMPKVAALWLVTADFTVLSSVNHVESNILTSTENKPRTV